MEALVLNGLTELPTLHNRVPASEVKRQLQERSERFGHFRTRR